MATTFWDERFSLAHYIYGEAPNAFLVTHADRFPAAGEILSLGEGEGRNAVYLAERGYRLTALDGSTAAMAKLERLAKDRGVEVQPWGGDVASEDLGTERWDGILNIFCHLPSQDRIRLYERIKRAIKPGGVFMTEQFSQDQLTYQSGGPKNPDMLLSLDELKGAFGGWTIEVAEAALTVLDEGSHHQGPGSVVRFLAVKPQ